MVFAQARETGLIKSEAKKVKTLHLAMAEFESAISDGKEIVCSFQAGDSNLVRNSPLI